MIIAQFKAARRCAVPLVGITTPDPAATIEGICAAVKDTIIVSGAEIAVPKIIRDIVRGLRSRNDAGKEAIAQISSEQGDLTIGNPVGALTLAQRLRERSILFIHLANRWMAEPAFVQALWNLRDTFKVDGRTLVLLGPSIDLPAELSGDVIMFDEALPDAEALEKIVAEQHRSAEIKLDAKKLTPAVEAIQGLPAFQAEQVVAMSLSKSGLDVPSLWERKRRQIELTAGLKVNREPVSFADIGASRRSNHSCDAF